MPVLDHEVHPSTKIGPDHRAGCWNKPRTRHYYMVKNGFGVTYAGNGLYESVQMWKEIRDPLSLECQYDQSIAPEHCAGCEHIKEK